MSSELNLKMEVTSGQLLEAIRTIHELPMERIKELFDVNIHFYGKDSLIKHVVNKNSAEKIVNVINTWKEQKTFHKNDIVKSYTSGKNYIITYIDDNEVTLIDAEGKMCYHSISSFERWFTKTGYQSRMEMFLQAVLG